MFDESYSKLKFYISKITQYILQKYGQFSLPFANLLDYWVGLNQKDYGIRTQLVIPIGKEVPENLPKFDTPVNL